MWCRLCKCYREEKKLRLYNYIHMDHRGLKINKVDPIEGTNNGILYLDQLHGMKTGDIVNIE